MTTAQDVFSSRFEIRGLLGEGGMGEVHLAYDAFLQREVAIKLANLKLLDDPEVGECIEEIAFLDESTHVRSATVRALSPLVIIEISAAGLRNGSAELQAAFGRAFIRIMLERIRHVDQRFLDLVQRSGS